MRSKSAYTKSVISVSALQQRIRNAIPEVALFYNSIKVFLMLGLTQEVAIYLKKLLICLATTQTRTKNSRAAG